MEQGDRNVLDCDHINLKNPSVIIDKIISLIQEQLTKNDITRQGEYFEKLMAVSKAGFFMKDLHDLMTLMELLLQHIEEVDEYSQYLYKILQACAIPPVMSLSSDVLIYSRPFQEYFTMLGYLLVSLKDENLQSTTVDVIISLLTKNKEERHYVPLKVRIEFAIASQLPEIVADLLDIADDPIYHKILQIMIVLIKDSSEMCELFIQHDAINSLLMRLERTWRVRYPNKPPPEIPQKNVLFYDTVSINMGILLKHLNKYTGKKEELPLPRLFSLWNLQYAYRYFTRTKQSPNRNNILIILLKLIKIFPELDFVRSGLAKDLTLVGLHSAYGITWAKDIKLSTDDDDYTYVVLLILALPFYVKVFGGIRVLEEQRVIYKLLNIARNKHVIKWNPPQACVISKLAIDILLKIVPHTEEEFMENNGPQVYLKLFLKRGLSLVIFHNFPDTLKSGVKILTRQFTLQSEIWWRMLARAPRRYRQQKIISEDTLDHSIMLKKLDFPGLYIINMYRTNDIDTNILKKCLEALLHIIKNTSMVLESIVYNSGVELIFDLCEHMVFEAFENPLGTKCLGISFIILDILYRHSPEKNNSIIKLTIAYMKKILSRERVLLRDIREIICVMNFVWEQIIKFEEYAKEFVQKNGTYLMLDIIQNFPSVVQLITLGALVDLCEFGHCIPYLITWKNKGQTILPMLMKLFRQENKRLKVKSGPGGEILNPLYPLMGKEQWFLTFCTCKPMMPGHACISDLYLSCRPKIYALLQMLYSRHKDKFDIANDHYKTFNEEHSLEDQVTQLVAENYLALKLGEAWTELRQEFERASISLTDLDSKILNSLTERATKLAQHLRDTQIDIIKNKYQVKLEEEKNLYTRLEEGKVIDALEALSELKLIARCSENMFRISEKYKQDKEIELAIKSHSQDIQRTYFSKIRVTPVFNETINLTSKTTTTNAEETYTLISPVTSEGKCSVDIPEDLLETPPDKYFDQK